MLSSETGKEVIKKELPLMPKLPGVYRMLNSKNEILYVGKAKNLTNRLKSYISEKNQLYRLFIGGSMVKPQAMYSYTNFSLPNWPL